MSEYKSKYKGQQIDNILGNAAQKSDLYKYATKAEVAEIEDKIPTKVSDLPNDKGYLTEHQDISNLATKEEVEEAISNITGGGTVDLSGYATKADLNGKVDKVAGKQLSTEDFTTLLKQKLDGLQNYDDTEVQQAVSKLRTDFDTLVSGDTTTAIETFNEVIAFLEGVSDTEDLEGIIASIEQQIAAKYTTPSTGIPKTDLASDVQTSLGKADTALQSYTEQYKGTITGIKMNGASKGSSGVVDLGNVITAHQDISGKQDKINDLEAIRSGASKGATALQGDGVVKRIEKVSALPTNPDANTLYIIV